MNGGLNGFFISEQMFGAQTMRYRLSATACFSQSFRVRSPDAKSTTR
jgi:hypothetical protein